MSNQAGFHSIFAFIIEGVESALRQAQAVAGEKEVYIFGPSLVAQALKLGVLDEIRLDLAPGSVKFQITLGKCWLKVGKVA